MASFTNQATLTYNNITVASNVVTGEITDAVTVYKTAVPDTYAAGEPVTYVITLVNSGTAPISGITLTDDLGAYAFGSGTLVPLTYDDGTAQYFADGVPGAAPTVTAGDTLVISDITVPAEGNAAVVYRANVNEFAPAVVGGEITNTVTVTGTGSEVTASASITAANEAKLAISKALAPCEVTANGQITYTFTISNTGNTAENTAVINDTFSPVLKNITVGIGGAAAQAIDYNYDETTGEFSTAEGALVIPAATFTQDPVTGAYTAVPGTLEVTVTGTV